MGALLAGRAPAQPREPEPAVQSTPDELRFVELANAERDRRGLRRLTVDPFLVRIARTHSREMCDKDYFDHNSPTPGLKTPMDRYLKAGGTYRRKLVVGENLFYCARPNVEKGHAAFMGSPKHRENVLWRDWESIGVGIYQSPEGEFWVTQMYLLKQ